MTPQCGLAHASLCAARHLATLRHGDDSIAPTHMAKPKPDSTYKHQRHSFPFARRALHLHRPQRAIIAYAVFAYGACSWRTVARCRRRATVALNASCRVRIALARFQSITRVERARSYDLELLIARACARRTNARRLVVMLRGARFFSSSSQINKLARGGLFLALAL